jgi:hypothetical protein
LIFLAKYCIITYKSKLGDTKMAKEQQVNKELSSIERRQIVRGVCALYHTKLAKNSPKQPDDLTFSQFMDLLDVDVRLDKVMTRELLRKANHKSPLSRWNEEVLKALKPFIGDVKLEETSETLKDDLIKVYIDYQAKNDPSLSEKDLKKITASKVTIWKFLDYIAEANSSLDKLPNLRKYGVNSLNWKLAHLKIEALKELQKVLPKAS